MADERALEGEGKYLGITDPRYKTYVETYPDLLKAYNKSWKGQGISITEYGAMHWHEYGIKERRSLVPEAERS